MRIRCAVIGGALLLGSLGWSGSASAAASDCEPPGGITSEEIARADRPGGGSEVTEYFGDGHYRVTRCAADGSLEVSQSVMAIRVPGGRRVAVPDAVATPDGKGGSVTASAIYGDPDEPTWVAQWRGHEERVRAAVLPPTDRASHVRALAQQTGTATHADTGGCGGYGLYGLTGAKWMLRMYTYYIYYPSLPGNRAAAQERINNGHKSWTVTLNPCGYSDGNNVEPMFMGDMGRTTNPFANDTFSVVDFGSLGSWPQPCPSALACNLPWRDGGGNAYETDTRFANGFSWYTGLAQPPAGSYDLYAIAAHESGHSIGLGHTPSKILDQTMSGVAFTDNRQRDLGASDVSGMRAIYP